MTLIVLRVDGFDPQDQRPGLWLAGDFVDSPVSDWSLSGEHYVFYLQTNTSYFVPHSVKVYYATLEGNLYLLSAYYIGGTFPGMRSWNRNIVRGPRIRFVIGDKLYNQIVSYMSDESIRRPIYDALGDKYLDW